MLDGVDPNVVDEIRHAAQHVEAVKKVTDVRARWLGSSFTRGINIAVPSNLSVADGHEVAKEVHHQFMHHLDYLSSNRGARRSNRRSRRRVSSHHLA